MKISLQQFNGSSTVMVVGEYTCKFTLLFANDFQENDQIRKDRSTDRETERVIERENWKRSCSVWKWITRLLYVQCHEEAFQETDDLIWIFTRPLICAAAIGGPSRFLHLLLPFFYRRLGDWGSFISFPANVSFVFFCVCSRRHFLLRLFDRPGRWLACGERVFGEGMTGLQRVPSMRITGFCFFFFTLVHRQVRPGRAPAKQLESPKQQINRNWRDNNFAATKKWKRRWKEWWDQLTGVVFLCYVSRVWWCVCVAYRWSRFM